LQAIHGTLRQWGSLALRVVLPLAGLGMLSTVFLLARTVDPSRAVALEGIDLSTITHEPRLGSSRFAGVTADGAGLIVTSQSTRSETALGSDDPALLHLDAPRGLLDLTQDDLLQFQAQRGRVDMGARMLTLQDDAELQTRSGYVARMQVLRAHLDKVDMIGEGNVSASGPLGEITALRLRVTAHDPPPHGHILEFEGNVHLVYQPPQD
jgi:lipopolysaccharide export system protein LptC